MGVTLMSFAYQRSHDYMLRGLIYRDVAPFIDNTYTKSKWDVNQHIAALRRVFDRYCQYNMKLRPSKCHFAYGTLEVLRHMVTSEGRKPVAQKVKAIVEARNPKNMTEVKSFLGTTVYYKRYIKG